MSAVKRLSKASLLAILSATTLLFAVYSGSTSSDEVKVALRGEQEIPPVTSAATGTGFLVVGPDKSVGGSVTVSGMTVTAAHIHEAPAGKNGPIVVPLTRTSDNVWTVPAGAKLTDAQYESYKAGNLYYNIHSAAYKGGEIRGQIKP
jgi:hypothetical protein